MVFAFDKLINLFSLQGRGLETYDIPVLQGQSKCDYRRIVLLTSGLMVALQGCSSDAKLRGEIEALRQELGALRAQHISLKSDLQLQRELLDTHGEHHSAVVLDLLEPGGYSHHFTPSGPVLVRVVKTEPYFQGLRATLAVGNLTSVTLTNLHYTVESPSSSKRTEGDLMILLQGGRWSSIRIFLPDFQPEKDRVVKLSLRPGGVQMF